MKTTVVCPECETELQMAVTVADEVLLPQLNTSIVVSVDGTPTQVITQRRS